MLAVILVFAISALGLFFLCVPIAKKGTQTVKKKKNTAEYNELAQMYDEEMEKNPADNIFTEIFDAILEHNENFTKEEEYRITRLPKANEVCFDTDRYGLSINSFGYILVTRNKGKKKVTEEYPLYLHATKTNLLTGFVPLPDAGIPLGTGKEVFTVLFGNEKEKTSKIAVGDTVEIITLFGYAKYEVYAVHCVSKAGLSAAAHNTTTSDLLLVVGKNDKYYKNLFYCKSL